MSTGYECQIRELKPGAWYYVLQSGFCPVGAWDWTEDASIVGPYATAALAHEGLSDNEANPGGYSEVAYTEARAEKNAALLARARAPRRGHR